MERETILDKTIKKENRISEPVEEQKRIEKEPLQVRRDFSRIMSVHVPIIKNLKVLKARQMKVMTKYGAFVEEEVNIPSNRFMNWTRAVTPYMDAVIGMNLADHELILAYEKYINSLIRYESDYVSSEREIANLEYTFDTLVDTVQRLENKINDLKETKYKEISMAKIHSINLYQSIPEPERFGEGHCIYCGITLNYLEGDYEKECAACHKLPERFKPDLSKTNLKMKTNFKGQKVFVKEEDEIDEEETTEEDEPEPFLDVEIKKEEPIVDKEDFKNLMKNLKPSKPKRNSLLDENEE